MAITFCVASGFIATVSSVGLVMAVGSSDMWGLQGSESGSALESGSGAISNITVLD